jgi:drug/metabolite transporter (DMT)-like permease
VAAFSLCALPVFSATGLQPARLHWSPAFEIGVAITAVFTTAIAFSVQFWAQQFTTATHAALIFALEPVVTAVTSYCFQGERLGGRALTGAALILAGILLAEIRPSAASAASTAEALGGPPP